MLEHEWRNLAGSPTAKFCLPINGRKSLYTCGESVITPNSVNCFHTLPNNINFPQKSPFVIPVSDGVMTGAS